MAETYFRAAVRVICVDARQRVFLQRWRDPADHAHVFWEPPGGGIEAGEDEPTTAAREVLEETGMLATPVPGRRVVVHRDLWWNGRHMVGPEPFLLATVDPDAPLAPHTLTEQELSCLLGTHWFTVDELRDLAEPTEPPELAAVVSALLEDGDPAHSTGR